MRRGLQVGLGALVAVAAVAAAAALLLRRERDPDVILVVMDTVRSDHLHACGHDKPNTPVLDQLVDDPAWSHVCDAVAPGAWTIPSHLSFFTGKLPIELEEAGADAPVETLAERFAARGYETALLSANMVLRKDARFKAGFNRFRTATNFNELKGPAYHSAFLELLDDLPRNKPAFLVLNLVDAHSPYAPIPRGVEWAPPQRGIQHRRFTTDETSPFYRFMHGLMSPEDSANYQRRLENGYDYGIFAADENVGRILDALAARGRLDRARVVVTSDHGELLGEHATIGHGDTLYEPGMRVPIFFLDTTRSSPLALPAGLSGIQVHHLLADGRLGPTATPFATNYHYQSQTAWDAVAWWAEDGSKLVWKDGETFRFDLAADPGEANRLPLEDHPDKAAFEALVERTGAVIERGTPFDDDTRRMLEQAGYLDPEPAPEPAPEDP